LTEFQLTTEIVHMKDLLNDDIDEIFTFAKYNLQEEQAAR